MINRSRDENKILILENGTEVLKDKNEFFGGVGVDDVIRVRADEYAGIDAGKEYLAVFNLEWTDSKVGEKFLVLKILRPGSYDQSSGREILPLLTLEDSHIMECLESKNYLKYEDITPDFFKYSLPGIQGVQALKETIYKRYHESMPGLSKEKIESLGVAYRLLKF